MECPRCSGDLTHVGGEVYLCRICASVFKIQEICSSETYELLKHIMDAKENAEFEL